MTERQQQILNDLAADTSATWTLLGCEIRVAVPRGEGFDCPLSFLAKSEPCDYEEAARRLDLSETEAVEIVSASDGGGPAELRSALLAACRLSEGAV